MKPMNGKLQMKRKGGLIMQKNIQTQNRIMKRMIKGTALYLFCR